MSEYNDYGYVDASMVNAHSYLVAPISCFLNHDVNKSILDIGCGNGAVASFLIDRGFNVRGIDASKSGIEIANTKKPGNFFIYDLSSNEIPKEIINLKFDTIISTEVVEHLYNPRKYVRFCKNILIKNGGGMLLVSTPYHGYLKNLIMAITGKMDFHFTALWDGGHIKFWSKKTLIQLFEEQGFSFDEFKGVGRFPFVWKSMILKFSLKN